MDPPFWSPGLDGQFETYSVCSHFPNPRHALYFLRHVAYITKNLMVQRGWYTSLLQEIDPSETPGLAGEHDREGTPRFIRRHYNKDSVSISLCLRKPKNPAKFLPLKEIVRIMVHELAHFDFGPSHFLGFYLMNYHLLRQLRWDVERGLLRGYVKMEHIPKSVAGFEEITRNVCSDIKDDLIAFPFFLCRGMERSRRAQVWIEDGGSVGRL